MKKSILFLSMLLVVMASCERDRILDLPPPGYYRTSHANSKSRSIDEAIEIAEHEADRLFPGSGRSFGHHTSSEQLHIISSPQSRSGEEDTLVYILDFTDNKGFAVIAAPRVADPVVAIIEQGNYQETVEAGIPEFNLCLAQGISYVSDAVNQESLRVPTPTDTAIIKPLKPIFVEKVEMDTLGYVNVPRRLPSIRWGQKAPIGNLCPNGTAGCAPLAMLHVMAQFKSPTQITYTYPGHALSSENLNWDHIKSHEAEHTDSLVKPGCYYNGADGIISRVAREIGYRCDAKYKSNGQTSVSVDNMKNVLKNILTGHTVSRTINYTMMDAGFALRYGAVIMTAKSKWTGSDGSKGDGGHAWIADGYHYEQIHYRYYEAEPYVDFDGSYIWTLYNESDSSSQSIFFDFGWNGRGNGYFYFASSNPLTTSFKIDGITYTYTFDSIKYFEIQ